MIYTSIEDVKDEDLKSIMLKLSEKTENKHIRIYCKPLKYGQNELILEYKNICEFIDTCCVDALRLFQYVFGYSDKLIIGGFHHSVYKIETFIPEPRKPTTKESTTRYINSSLFE